MLRLQAQSITPFVDMPIFPRDRSIEEIPRVELHSGLRRRNFQHASARRFVDASRERQPCALTIDDEIMVVAMAEHELFIVVIDPRADLRRSREIKRRAFHRTQLARGDQVLVHRSESIGVDHDFMIQNVAVPFALQIEIAVLAEVHRSSFVGRRFIIKDQFIRVGQRISYLHLQDYPGNPPRRPCSNK